MIGLSFASSSCQLLAVLRYLLICPDISGLSVQLGANGDLHPCRRVIALQVFEHVAKFALN
jgi:hypothetical protein